ncbi:conjugal transfer protein [Enterococcus faecalis]|uniref:conjugal transfer protein n=1 Tax=Enterococcus faecalis TaxID=1351 RepID=UPI0013D6CC30|nr:conjugal transfer protein [Enterococcus faecalis]EJM6035954.1 conjugal transfer protein [Enterococcus faecalis]EJX8003683.1 conjugal transfer protein [Enterococcus faecalis]EME3233140.1 conjugal transfer protein [Enterococcus faecalis]NFA65020.1 conjugal transfer protein [Enterococcus faecalis]NSR38027.1 conjugal transfer protein [Enterococcus faecalis]
MNLKKIKKKEKKEKISKVKTFSQKKANQVVLIGASVLLVMSGVGAIRANVMASNVDNLYSKVDTLSEQSKKNKVDREELDYSALSFYTENFAKEYLNYNSKASDEAKKARIDRLSKYLSLDVKDVDETENLQGNVLRTFKNTSLSRIEKMEDCYLVYLNVSYEWEKDKKTENVTQNMVLPIQVKDNLFSIVGRPYFVASSLPQGKTVPLKQTENSIDVGGKEKQSIEKFLKMFFTKYSVGNKQELMLLMKNPTTTTGQDSFVSIDSGDIKFFDTKQKDVTGVQVSVTFSDKTTKLTHTEDFSLWLSKTENSYFVNTMRHYFTEKEGND